MLEGLVATLLNRFLGMYVKNFDPGQLKVGIWSGDVKLSALELRREALDQLKLPINVAEGHIGDLTLTIPWSNLRGQPVKVFINDVYVLAAPREAEYDEEEEERRRQAVKVEKLDSADMLRDKTQSLEETKRNQSFTTSLVETIVNNLQISVTNIHIRYEDAISAPGHPFALGVTLQEFSAVSTDSSWTPTYVQSGGTNYKLATLGALAVYWNTDTTLLGDQSHADMLEAFRHMITAEHQYILKPVSGKAKLEMDKTIKAGLTFEEIGLVLDDDQYRDALMMVELFHYFIRHQEYKKYRPQTKDPRAWLRFAGTAILTKIHERHRQWSWDYFRERRDDRRRYIELFKSRKRDTLTPTDTDEINQLEWKYSYEDLRFFRSLARTQLRKEGVTPAPQPQKGWLSWAWGSKSESQEMTDEQRKELYEAIDWDEKAIVEIDLPRDMVKTQIDARLNTGSFTLRRAETQMISFYFDAFQSQLLQRPDSFLADVSLGGLRVNDATTAGSLYPQIVTHTQTAEPFFAVQLEQHPLDNSADLAVTAKLKSLELVWNPQMVVEVANFFKPPERHMDSVAALLESAGATVEGFRQQTRAGLEFALQEHKTINAQLDLQAPLIIIPESVCEKSTCLIVDAGHIAVTSQLVDQDTIKEATQKQTYSDADYERLESLMYDKFSLKLQDTQVLIGPSVGETKAQLTGVGAMHMVDRTTVDFTLEICIVPKSPLTKFKLSGHLPVLHASVSDVKYKSLMRVLDVAIPKSTEAPPPVVERPTFVPRQAAIVDDSDDEFVDAVDGLDLQVHQKTMEVKFTVAKLQGSLLRHVDGRDQLLVEVVAEHFDLGFWLRAYDMTAVVSLKSFDIIDCINPTPDFKSLVSGQGDRKLVQVQYTKVKRQSPEFMSVYGGIDTTIGVDISTINVVLTRMTVLQLLDFLTVTFTSKTSTRTPVEAPPSPDKLQIKVKLQSIVLVLNNDGTRLATLTLSTADVGLLMGKTMRIAARLEDMSLFTDKDKLVSIEGDNLADFQYETYDDGAAIRLRTGSVRVNFLDEPFQQIIQFMVNFGRMKTIVDSARQAATQQSSTKMQFDIIVKTPIVVFPRAASKDLLTAYLGEFYLTNKFVPLTDAADAPIVMKIQTGMRNIRVTSDFFFGDDRQELELLNKVDVDFAITHGDHIPGAKRPDTEISGHMTDFNLQLTQTQLKFLLELSRSVPGAFATDAEPLPPPEHEDQSVDMRPEIIPDTDDWTKVDFSFDVGLLGLELIMADGPLVASLSKFSLDKVNVKLRMLSNSSIESQLLIKAFTIVDSRTRNTNRFRKIMTSTNEKEQFMASVTLSDKNLIAMVAIDSPRVIFALDYVIAIQSFLTAGLAGQPDAARPSTQPSSMSVAFRVNLVDAQIILIANPLTTSSEAIVLGTKQILLSQQNSLTLQVSEVGMFLCRMDRSENLRILDDFSVQLLMDGPIIHVDVEPLVLRLSLRDILLALQIFTKASELKAPPQASAPQKSQHQVLTAYLDGVRLILIGDVHELPMLDLSVKAFAVHAEDWSSQLRADTKIDMYINVFNFSKSAWEPLMEPWQLAAQIEQTDVLSVDLQSPTNMDITLTSATIGLATKSAHFLSTEEDVFKPRGVDAPYKIRNHTGFQMEVWSDNQSKTLEEGSECPWAFEDTKTMRESLNTQDSLLSVRLEGSGFESVTKISVSREGETLYSLRPRQDVVHRLLVEINLGSDNVKYIIFRSPLLVENLTQIPVEIGVFDAQDGHLLKIEKIAPGDNRPAPVGAAYQKSLLVRPDQGFGYSWSSEVLWWRDLLKTPTMTLTCKGEHEPFYIQMTANFDRTNPQTRVYPNMRIRLSAPIELQNLLPYDFKYRIYDKNTKKDWTNFLRRGGLSPVHVVELSHLLLMSIDMQDTPFKPSEFAIINSRSDDFRRENKLVCKDDAGLSLNLRLHYYKIPNSGGAFRVTVYSPYIILNKTGLDISIKSKSLLQQARASAGQTKNALPHMFSYTSDDTRNRALLRVGESSWSKPQSFEAVGSTVEVVLPSTVNRSEIHIGITVAAGEGKYKLTKVVTLAPRFILNNQLEELQVREPGSPDVITLKKSLQPLHFLQRATVKQLCLCFPGLNNQWSSPFNISDLGTTHVKLAKAGERQQLIRIEVLMEDATIFLHLSRETSNWPFSMRNESSVEFFFCQSNPNDDDETEDRSGWRPIRYRLPPRSIMPYAWDYPAAKQKELVISAHGVDRHVRLAEIGNLIPMKLPGRVIDLNVTADGPTQTLVLSNFEQSRSLYKKTREDFEVKAQDMHPTFKTSISLTGIGVSLINTQMRELAYLTLRGVDVKYNESKTHQTLGTMVKWIQIDNQLYGGIFPMILYPSVVPKKDTDTPCLHAMVTRVRDDSYGVVYIKYATVLLQQMTLEIDEDFVFAVLDFSKVTTEKRDILCDDTLEIPEPKQLQGDSDIYFELLNIQPMQLDLSFVRTDRVNVEDKTSSRNPLMFFLNVLTMAMGNINDAPLRLNALMLENARVSSPVLVQNISSHYTQEVLYQMHKILGSADFLGNPVGLFNNISSGVADMFYEPIQGLIMSPDKPEQLGVGFAKGTTSFVKKSVFGVSDSISKVTGSISKGLAAATLDKQFQDRRRMARSRNRPKHALYGVTAGANSFVTSVADGIGGLGLKPLEGAEQEGALGFFKGVGKGVLGLATKPAIGVFDLASSVSEGIKNTTTVFDDNGLDRVRLTRFIGRDGIVRPYSQREALGQFWLKQLDNGRYFDDDYLAHLESRDDVVIMVTYSRILKIKSKKLTSDWDMPLKNIQKISKERTGLSLADRDGNSGPFIPVAEESSRNFLYQKIAIAVNDYNKKYRAE